MLASDLALGILCMGRAKGEPMTKLTPERIAELKLQLPMGNLVAFTRDELRALLDIAERAMVYITVPGQRGEALEDLCAAIDPEAYARWYARKKGSVAAPLQIQSPRRNSIARGCRRRWRSP